MNSSCKKDFIKHAPEVNSTRKAVLKKFAKGAGIRFRRYDLLNLAFSHRSYANESSDVENNEKLEFLGDSVLGLSVTEYLYHTFPEKTEGDLAKIKSYVVSEEVLNSIAQKINLSQYLLVGKGEELSGGRRKKALLADCMEAVIGAYYLDRGFKAARKFVLDFLIPEIELVLKGKHKKDYKTLLQEFVQKKYKICPKYSLVKKTGPDHDKTFYYEVKVNGRICGEGVGKSRKEAEQKAAKAAYSVITPN